MYNSLLPVGQAKIVKTRKMEAAIIKMGENGSDFKLFFHSSMYPPSINQIPIK